MWRVVYAEEAIDPTPRIGTQRSGCAQSSETKSSETAAQLSNMRQDVYPIHHSGSAYEIFSSW
jgi:hypothetical protein